MESDLELSEAENRFTQEDLDRMREDHKLLMEDIRREKMAKKEDYTAEEMNLIDKMLRRRRERLLRNLGRRQTAKKKNNSKSEDESFNSDSVDEEMKIAQEKVKRLMEKVIRAKKEDSKSEKKESKAEEKKEDYSKSEKEEPKDIANEEMVFPRRRGRSIRFLRRRSKSPESAFQIEFHHLQLPSDDSDDSDEEMNKALPENMTSTLT